MGWFGPSGDCGCCGDDCGCVANPSPACNEYYDSGGETLKTQKVASVTIAGVINQAAANCDGCLFLNDTFLFTPCAVTTYSGQTVICDRLFGGWVRYCAWVTGTYTLSVVGSNLVATLTVVISSSNNVGTGDDGPDPRPSLSSCTGGAAGSFAHDTRTWVYSQTVPLVNAHSYSDCAETPECEDKANEMFETYPEITALSFVSETDSTFSKFACDLSSSTISVSLV